MLIDPLFDEVDSRIIFMLYLSRETNLIETLQLKTEELIAEDIINICFDKLDEDKQKNDDKQKNLFINGYISIFICNFIKDNENILRR